MSVHPRPGLDALPAYVPGRTVTGAVKLASNETSYPMLAAVTVRIAEAAMSANRYPDASQTGLTAALAARFALAPQQVMVGCGSVALCQQVVQAFAAAGDEVLFPWRSFEAYPIVTAVAEAVPVTVPIRDDQSFDLDRLAAAVTPRTRVVFICTPNNPTGSIVGRGELAEFLGAVGDEVLVVIDEAYREFVTDPDAADGLELLDRPNVVVLRTFSKAYGLAGLRVGYGLATDPAVAAAVRSVQVPFAVSQLAQAAALICLEPEVERELMARVQLVTAERDRVTKELSALGLPVTPSQANFVWLALGGDAARFAVACEAGGVIVRDFAGYGVRITIGRPDENDHLVRAATAATG
ncbi:MAG: histidinol-phosphate transaminase [Actinomycetota bacterium]|nr:histidinol-phosphate transaminase [Actinomycetota bacterium]